MQNFKFIFQVDSRWADLDNDRDGGRDNRSGGYGGRRDDRGYERRDDRGYGGGRRDDRLAGKWDTRGAYSEDVDWTKPLPRDER